ncbi:hypothetical protein A2954_01015 [Candidatus Roizmanbacteria bacterium RIFCSPLOWO2_01_FULL_37_12]|uniref:Glycosyltransferase 2-like domain-containing protein n=1 Tax=Candidatus Roizmanbacteria bacterium RIFCSPLOWO2_01_FULL_37_12 TaxID=1802056 RepID=A0A1F7IGC4_9BACT|nr:MAG: hypothetical protein A3D76_00240 [Candidatus Roizmanbacteria bacterium RIFCSPHIGHO2_02_FULL_37_9b]OGK42407.1 MAG: hypothetical protein A2954_01015 [Candidatus Roizmanbacteria bacterium RIFCSPLOWO2_01_FULL_37_12]
MKKNVIITSSNKRDGDFLVQHWFRSLKENVDLRDIDIVVLDYGLNKYQKQKLQDEKVKVIREDERGHIVNQRFIDAGTFLSKCDYDQVLFTDAGDIIFQEDISNLFKTNKDSFRVVPADMEVYFFEYFIPGNFSKRKGKKIYNFLKDKLVLNAGFIIAPSLKFINLCREIKKLVKDKNKYGPDQIAINYSIYREKYVFLDKKYNFLINTGRVGFKLKRGVFYKKNGEKIAVVHNGGRSEEMRLIDNFGYGKKYNKTKEFLFNLKKFLYANVGLLKAVLKLRI